MLSTLLSIICSHMTKFSSSPLAVRDHVRKILPFFCCTISYHGTNTHWFFLLFVPYRTSTPTRKSICCISCTWGKRRQRGARRQRRRPRLVKTDFNRTQIVVRVATSQHRLRQNPRQRLLPYPNHIDCKTAKMDYYKSIVATLEPHFKKHGTTMKQFLEQCNLEKSYVKNKKPPGLNGNEKSKRKNHCKPKQIDIILG